MRPTLVQIAGAVAALALLAGCVAIEDYERKADEASSLRRELDASRNKVSDLVAENDKLRQRIKALGLESQELSQSLSMARRHGQQVETGVADLRSRISSQEQDIRGLQRQLASLRKERQELEGKLRKTEARLVKVRRRLFRFEDRVRLQEQVTKDFKAQFATQARAGLLKVLRDGDRVVLRIASRVLFRSGSANIRKQGQRLLRQIAPVLRRYANRELQVRGHTDNVRISERLAEHWETNWELSAARATRVLRYLVEIGNVDPRRASAAGLGEFSPIASNATREGRSRNRRIEIVVFPPDLP